MSQEVPVQHRHRSASLHVSYIPTCAAFMLAALFNRQHTPESKILALAALDSTARGLKLIDICLLGL